jgi:hypothetical protein
MLEDLGTSQRTISAVLRHAGDTLAQKVYVDRRQLDLRRWLDALPVGPLHGEEPTSGAVRDSDCEALTRGEAGNKKSRTTVGPPAANPCQLMTTPDTARTRPEAGIAGPNRPQTHEKTASEAVIMQSEMERLIGFEPTTSTLARLRSTTELQPHGGS